MQNSLTWNDIFGAMGRFSTWLFDLFVGFIKELTNGQWSSIT